MNKVSAQRYREKNSRKEIRITLIWHRCSNQVQEVECNIEDRMWALKLGDSSI